MGKSKDRCQTHQGAGIARRGPEDADEPQQSNGERQRDTNNKVSGCFAWCVVAPVGYGAVPGAVVLTKQLKELQVMRHPTPAPAKC